MNQEFRGHIFELEGIETEAGEGGNSELIPEIVQLFAYMRYSWVKLLDTSGFIQSIRNFENDPIDITVQMDVDEFYNLLFDRLDSQIADKSKRDAISHCYGGMLLTQIKSKECEHVSERTEPFSAIQCDIKGKCDLQQSLDAYVEGEIMEGDNKYWCSQCSTHVEAEKRNCLQEVPDHLIFHLKRFDFDLATMQRSKINDYFEFPTEIDIAPYTFEHVATAADMKANDQPDVSDMFRISGVLVHTGTAESGHYFSYIRDEHGWVEFNDAETSRFEEGQIGSMAYGGTCLNASGEVVEKPFSAYMLFYERIDKIKPEQTKEIAEYAMRNSDLYSRICEENQKLTLKWSMFGYEHLKFVNDSYERLCSARNSTECDSVAWASHDHVMFETLFQVASRTKDGIAAEEMLATIQKCCTESARSSMAFLAWLADSDVAARGLLVRCANAQVREDVSRLIRSCMLTLQDKAATMYGSLELWTDSCRQDGLGDVSEKNIISSLVQQLADVLLCRTDTNSPPNSTSAGRGSWSDLCGLLLAIVDTGVEEAALCVCAGVLRAGIAAVYDGRGDVAGLAVLILKLIKRVDLSSKTVSSLEDRCEDVSKRYREEGGDLLLPMIAIEYELLCRGFRQSSFNFLRLLIEQEVPAEQVIQFVIDFLTRAEEDSPLSDARIMFGTGTRSAMAAEDSVSMRPFLRYLLKLVDVYRPSFAECKRLCRIVLPMERKGLLSDSEGSDEEAQDEEEADAEIESQIERCGEAIALFIAEASMGKAGESMKRAVRITVAGWAPLLLVHWSAAVRIETVQALKVLLFASRESDDGNEQQKIISRLVQAMMSVSAKRWRDGRRSVTPVDGLEAVLVGCEQVIGEEDEGTAARIDMLRQAVSSFGIASEDKAGML